MKLKKEIKMILKIHLKLHVGEKNLLQIVI